MELNEDDYDNEKEVYEFGDFSFLENNRDYYNHVIFLVLIDKYSLWDFVKDFSHVNAYSNEFTNTYLIFEDYYNNSGQMITRSEYVDIMENFEEICNSGWDMFVEENI